MIAALLSLAVAGAPVAEPGPAETTERAEPTSAERPDTDRLPPVDHAPPGVPGPKGLGFDFRRAGHAGVGAVTGLWTTGLSLKVMVSRSDALQATFGASWTPFAYWPGLGVGLGLDWLHHAPPLWENDLVRLAWNLGLGADIRIASGGTSLDLGVGAHAVGGLELLFTRVPVDLTFEYRPGVLANPLKGGGLAFTYGDLAVHARWWF